MYRQRLVSKLPKSSCFIPNSVKKPPVSSPVSVVWDNLKRVWNDIYSGAEALILLAWEPKSLAIKELRPFLARAIPMVEMTGIEPVSESISSGLSPSAAIGLEFRVCCRPIAGCGFGYPVIPSCCQDFTWGFLHVWRSASGLQVNLSERAGCYAANAKLLFFLAFIFNVSFLR